ncbi:hypothetical protein [Ensifer canadensis]
MPEQNGLTRLQRMHTLSKAEETRQIVKIDCMYCRITQRYRCRDLLAGVRVNHRIERAGAHVDDAEIADLLATELWNVPEGLAKDMVGIDANKREAAKEAIARTLLIAMTGNYTCTFFQPEHHGMGESLANTPGSAFYQGQPKYR